MTAVRADVSENDLRNWFKDVDLYLKSKNCLNLSPTQIFNCDETNIHLCPKRGKVLTMRGNRTVYNIVNAVEKESATVLFTYSATGIRAPPMVLYKYAEGIPKKVLEKFPSGWGIGNSENGWMTIETFYEYITNVFYPWLIKEKIQFPVVLYLDGHLSHMTIPLANFCRQQKIEIIGLYPNSTHLIQSLDVAFISPFKAIWRREVKKWRNEFKLTRLTKAQFPAVLERALAKLDEQHILKNGFRTSGLYPFNANAVHYNLLKKKGKTKKYSNDKSAKNGQMDNSISSNESISFFEQFERSLPIDTLEEFRKAAITQTWTGGKENQGLFFYWLKLKFEGTN